MGGEGGGGRGGGGGGKPAAVFSIAAFSEIVEVSRRREAIEWK